MAFARFDKSNLRTRGLIPLQVVQSRPARKITLHIDLIIKFTLLPVVFQSASFPLHYVHFYITHQRTVINEYTVGCE